MNGVKEEKKLL